MKIIIYQRKKTEDEWVEVTDLYWFEENYVHNFDDEQYHFIIQIDGEEYSAKVKEFHDAIQGGCAYCNDFVAWLSDVSVGSVGSSEGFSTVIVRSDIGKKLLENVDFIKDVVNINDIKKLADFKKKRAEKNFSPIIQGKQ